MLDLRDLPTLLTNSKLLHMRGSTDFSYQRHIPSSLAVGATLMQEDFFVRDLATLWQLGIGMMPHIRSLLIEDVVTAFHMLRLRRVVSGLLNAVVVAPGPLVLGRGLPT
jgi:hypothetical protein